MIKNDPALVSIGLPVFNGEKLLRRSLDSLLAQDYTNFELIISDNASTDGTEALCRDYAAHDGRIRYIRQEHNLGSHENFNFVLQAAQGKYFMWAAADDQWAASFIRLLLTDLENDPGAMGAFCSYQLIEEETAAIIDGIWSYSYQNPHAFVRLLKFTWYYRDTCIYGLMRRESMRDIKFVPWAWLNANTPYNIAYPIVYFFLSRGNLLSVKAEPLWFKSVRTSYWHSTPFTTNPLLGYVAHVVRKINLVLRSAHYIYKGSRSVWLVLLIFPVLLLRFIVDCLTPFYAIMRIWLSGKKINQLSPHEIWRLGVR